MKRLFKWAALGGVIALAFKFGRDSGVHEAVAQMTTIDPEAGAKLRAAMSTVVIPADETEAAMMRGRADH